MKDVMQTILSILQKVIVLGTLTFFGFIIKDQIEWNRYVKKWNEKNKMIELDQKAKGIYGQSRGIKFDTIKRDTIIKSKK